MLKILNLLMVSLPLLHLDLEAHRNQPLSQFQTSWIISIVFTRTTPEQIKYFFGRTSLIFIIIKAAVGKFDRKKDSDASHINEMHSHSASQPLPGEDRENSYGRY